MIHLNFCNITKKDLFDIFELCSSLKDKVLNFDFEEMSLGQFNYLVDLINHSNIDINNIHLYLCSKKNIENIINSIVKLDNYSLGEIDDMYHTYDIDLNLYMNNNIIHNFNNIKLPKSINQKYHSNFNNQTHINKIEPINNINNEIQNSIINLKQLIKKRNKLYINVSKELEELEKEELEKEKLQSI